MSKAQGFNTHTLLKREATWGVDPEGNYVKIPVNSNNLGPTRGLMNDSLAGQGRDPRFVHKDVTDVSGELGIPVDVRNIGFFLTGLLGDPTTTEDTGVYTHTFKSGALTLPSYAIETGHKGPGVYEQNLGCMINTMRFEATPGGGPAAASVGIIGKSGTPYETTKGGTPTEQTLARFSNFQGTLKKGGVNLGNIKSFNFTFSNNLTADRVLNQSGNVGAIEPGETSITGSMVTRFTDDTILNEAVAHTAMDLDLIYQIDADNKLDLTLHELYAEVTKPAIDGPGGYDLSFNFRGVYNSSNSAAFTAVLVNDLAGTVYTS